jgi:hypothetical protein
MRRQCFTLRHVEWRTSELSACSAALRIHALSMVLLFLAACGGGGGGNTCLGYGDFCGTLFKITPAGAETVLYAFGASATDGLRWCSRPISGRRRH